MLLALLLVVSASNAAYAGWGDDDDDDEPEIEFDPDPVAEPQPEAEPEPEIEPDPVGEPEPEPEPEPDLSSDLASVDSVKADQQITLGEDRVSWKDIVVVVRKPFLKVKRLEVLPMFGVTMNDNIIQHLQSGAQVNYYLTDVLAIGAEAAVYVKNLREPFDLVARQARRLPTVNKYNYSAALNFSYVPVYGKFAVLDQKIITWEVLFTAGVGMTQSEVIPRDPAFRPFSNLLITPNVGASMRFFLTKFLTVTVGLRDYVFVDRFESVGRTEIAGAAAKENADSALINNVMFQAGLSIWFPMSFEYTTFR